jgi:hypothetical protein
VPSHIRNHGVSLHVGHGTLKAISILADVVTLGPLILYIPLRSSGLPPVPPQARLNVVLHLTLAGAVVHGVLWTLAERLHGWDFGAGGRGVMPSGYSAFVLSLTVTLPLALLPPLYEQVMGVQITLPGYWRAVPIIILSGAVSHIIMYGTGHNFRGLRKVICRDGPRSLRSEIAMELAYATIYFGLLVLPYRLVLEPVSFSLLHTLVGRTILPGLTFAAVVISFVVVTYPASLTDSRAAELRGMVSAVALMFCLYAGMFV